MAVEEVVRLKATVVTDQALANIRALGREIGIMPSRVGRGVKEVDTQFRTLGETIRSLGTGMRAAVPAFGAFSLGAAGLGYVASRVVRGMGDISKSVVELSNVAKQLGMTTQEVQGFAAAAEKAGIAPQAMLQGLQEFRKNTEDFALRVGSLREQMMEVGFGPVLQRINEAKEQTDKLKVAWDMAEVLGRDSAAAKRLFDMLGIGSEKLRFSWNEFQQEKAKQPLLSEKEIADAKRYNDLMIDLARGWDNLKQKFVLGLFDTTNWEKEKERFKDWGVPAGAANAPQGNVTGLDDMGIPQFQTGGMMPNTGLALLHAGEKIIPAGGDILEGSDDTLTKTTKEGTYQALVQYASYSQAAGGGAMQGLGGLPGFGGAGGGGGFGGGGGGGGGAGGGGGGGGSGPSASLGDTGASPGAGMSTSAADQGDRPGHYTGTVTLGGKEFQYGTGGQGRGSMPIGTHAINIGKGDIGPIGQRIGSIATVGKLGGNIYDPKIQSMRGGMQIHGGFSEKLEYLRSQGCFAIKPSQWPAFKKALIEENSRTPGGLQLSIGKDGRAQISARSDAPAGSRQVAQGAVRPDSSPPPVSGLDAPTARIDTANDAQAQPPAASGEVAVSITSDGSAARGANGGSPDLFQPSSVRNTQQMQRTEDAGAGAGHGP